jgi:RND family efflux transporter MFP subunit
VILYLIETPSGPWKVKAKIGEVRLAAVVPLETGQLSELAKTRDPLVLTPQQLAHEDYAHLGLQRALRSWAGLPIWNDKVLVGALEVVSFDDVITESDLAAWAELVDDVGPALAVALAHERERVHYMAAVSRLVGLYDLEKVFSSTLEMSTLFDLVPSKFRDMLQVRAVNLWMVKDQEQLELVGRAGEDPSTRIGSVQQKSEGLVAQVSDSGEPKLISDPHDAYLEQRNAGLRRGTIFSLMAAPLVARGDQVGVVETVDKLDGTVFNDDDLAMLTSLAETAAQALINANLLKAERKVQILQTLVKVSTELASTLDLEHVLQALVHLPGAVLPYERAAVALEQRGKLQLKAVSGMTRINHEDPDVQQLTGMLAWASAATDIILVTQHGDKINGASEENRLRFARYFAKSSMRAVCALALADGEGNLGVLCFESSDPDFLSPAHLEMVRVLGAQATVALRNASLYKDVPFISVLGPLLQKKQKFFAMEKRRRAVWIGAAVAAVIFLAGFPVPLRVEGDATVAPARTAQVQTAIEGVIRTVYVREGQWVKEGQLLGDLEDWDYRSALAASQAKYQIADSEVDQALSLNDSSAAGIKRAQADYWAAEVERSRQRLEKTHLHAPFDGWVTTGHIEDFAGRHLSVGDTFAEIVDNSLARVDVAIDDQDVLLLRPDASAQIKLDSLPVRTFHGQVAVVSPKGTTDGSKRYFLARITLPNSDKVLRPGMQGRGKISVGWRPAGYVLFRRPALWGYSKLWSWIGW